MSGYHKKPVTPCKIFTNWFLLLGYSRKYSEKKRESEKNTYIVFKPSEQFTKTKSHQPNSRISLWNLRSVRRWRVIAFKSTVETVLRVKTLMWVEVLNFHSKSTSHNANWVHKFTVNKSNLPLIKSVVSFTFCHLFKFHINILVLILYYFSQTKQINWNIFHWNEVCELVEFRK